MSVTQKAFAAMKYQLGGALKKNGVNLWRFVFLAFEKTTGNERMFFIEFAMLNPWLSPSDVLLGFKPRVKISAEDLQHVLAGTDSAQRIKSETLVVPSYTVLRAGTLGDGAKQLCRYFPVNDVVHTGRSFDIQIKDCRFDENSLEGSVKCSPSEVSEHPEYLCDSGSMSWNLRYDFLLSFENGYKTKELSWQIPGAKAVFSGEITLDGKEYNVIPRKSYGYVDRNWGSSYPSEWFHLSSSNIASLVSGKSYQNSSFALQGVYDGRISLVVNLEGKSYSFTANSRKGAYSSAWNCTQMPETEDGEKLHWSVSVNNRSLILDIDVFCLVRQLYLRNWELPDGERKTLKILAGGTGDGEIRLYKQHGKNLELLEHCRVAGVFCEYGQPEETEN